MKCQREVFQTVGHFAYHYILKVQAYYEISVNLISKLTHLFNKIKIKQLHQNRGPYSNDNLNFSLYNSYFNYNSGCAK